MRAVLYACQLCYTLYTLRSIFQRFYFVVIQEFKYVLFLGLTRAYVERTFTEHEVCFPYLHYKLLNVLLLSIMQILGSDFYWDLKLRVWAMAFLGFDCTCTPALFYPMP